MSKQRDTVYTDQDLPLQPANHTPNANRSNSKSHLKVTNLTRQTAEDIVARVS